MSEERGGRCPDPSTESLRASLRSWIDANQHDPGIAIAELLAYLAEALGALQDRTAEESFSPSRRYLSVRLQQGRVIVDTDWNEGTPGPPRWGLYRGTVVDATDPLAKGRLRVEVPSVSASATPWAMPCFGPGEAPVLPAPGGTVWVGFEEGDVDRPVWLGVAP